MPRTHTQPTTRIRTLESLGLSGHEAQLYLTLLAMGPSTVQQLRVRTPFARTLLYHMLDTLLEHELVISHKHTRRTVYSAQHPHALEDLLTKHEASFAKDAAALRSLVPELTREHCLAVNRLSVRTAAGLFEKS
jgi:sugar-specific transcriptional regulator TrmB